MRTDSILEPFPTFDSAWGEYKNTMLPKDCETNIRDYAKRAFREGYDAGVNRGFADGIAHNQKQIRYNLGL
jgi:hypothetical protein